MKSQIRLGMMDAAIVMATVMLIPSFATADSNVDLSQTKRTGYYVDAGRIWEMPAHFGVAGAAPILCSANLTMATAAISPNKADVVVAPVLGLADGVFGTLANFLYGVGDLGSLLFRGHVGNDGESFNYNPCFFAQT